MGYFWESHVFVLMFCCLLLVVVVCLFRIFVLYFLYSDYHYVLLINLNLFCYHLVFIYILLVVNWTPLENSNTLYKVLAE